MSKQPANLAPSTLRLLAALGERVRLARLRRNLSQTLVAQRAGLALATFRAVEAGSPNGSMGSYLAVLEVMGLVRDLDSVAQVDELGRTLQDSQLPTHATGRRRARGMKTPVVQEEVTQAAQLETKYTTPLPKTTTGLLSSISLDELVSFLQTQQGLESKD